MIQSSFFAKRASEGSLPHWQELRPQIRLALLLLLTVLLTETLAASLIAQPADIPGAPNAREAPQAPIAEHPPAATGAKPPPSAAELQRAAIAQQRAAIRVQAEALGLWLLPLTEATGSKPSAADPVEPPGCDPLGESVVKPLLEDAAKRLGLDSRLLRALMRQESAFRPCAVSAKGAQGLMQLMPDTAAELGIVNPFDPAENVDGGARYLKQLLEKYKGDVPQALGAYNAGPKTVDESGGVPNVDETRQYVDAVLAEAGLKPAAPEAKPATPPATSAPDTPLPPKPGQPTQSAGPPASPRAEPAAARQ